MILGPQEWLLIIVAVILLFLGPKKLPALARSIGKSIGEFKKGMHESKEIKKSSKKLKG